MVAGGFLSDAFLVPSHGFTGAWPVVARAARPVQTDTQTR